MLISRDGAGGDDHGSSRTYIEETPLYISDLITYLKKEDFFCEVTEESMWSLTYNGKEFALYKPVSGCSYRGISPEYIRADDDGNVHFRLFLNGEERAEYLFRRYYGNKKDMYFAGYMEEYRSYQINSDVEQKWRDTLISEGIYQDFSEKEHVNEAFVLMKNIMRRPVIYVGCGRLDLVQTFFDGWCMHQKSLWSISYDLKQWLFLMESISGSCSLNGWSNFYEAYGRTELAMSQFRDFINTLEPSCVFDHGSWDTATEHIDSTCYSCLYPEGPKAEIKPYMDYTYSDSTTDEEAHHELIRQVKRIIGSESKRIILYINHGRPVMQVRFLFDDGNGWKDGVSLNHTSDYYEKMVALHGYVKLFRFKVHREEMITIFWTEGIVRAEYEEYHIPKFQFSYDVPQKEEDTMSYRFNSWKERMITEA